MSRDQRATGSVIQQERAEILRLIKALHRAGSARPPSGTRIVAAPVVRAPTPRAQVVPIAHGVPREETPAGILATLQRIETRLDRIEETLRARGSTRPAQMSGIPETYLLAGCLHETMLADVLQLVTTNAMTGVFVVEGAFGAYVLHFQEGEIFDAEGPEVRGESAVFGALAVEQGRFYFEAVTEPPAERTIHANTQFLVLEALRHIDEKRARDGPTTSVQSTAPAFSRTR